MNLTSFIFESTGKGVFWRSALLSVGMFLLLSVAGLSSSSEADEPLFMRSAQQLERLWSGVLGCRHPGDGAPRSTFETTFDGGGVPSAVNHDYAECGKRALRNTGSRILVDTIEDALSRGGVALFSDRFRLDSSIAWVWEESVTGEIDAVIPLFSRERSDGTGQAIFIQPGAVFWQGLNSEERIDGNLGIVYRQHLTPSVVAGGSVFYDYDFKRESQRVGAGLDLQSGPLQTALNYYHPLNDWQEGRTDYEEQPLQGADFHLGFAWSRIRFDTSFGIWRFEGEEEESTKWRPAFEVGAGYRIYPGVFLQGGYENHDSEDSLDSRWNAGLEFRFSLPGLEGAVDDKVAAKPNLWEPVEREKRILYEEREAIPRVALRPASAVDENGGNVDPSLPLAQPDGDSGMTTVVIAGELEALSVEAALQIVVEDSTATAGEDYNYGYKVYQLNAETGEQSAPDDAVDCGSASMCEMTIPAGVTRFDIEVDILKDADPKEIREDIVLRVDIPEEHQRALRGNETRLTIEAHGNTVGFDMTNSASEFVEDEGPVSVIVEIDEPSPTPLRVTVTPGGNEATVDRDYMISTTTLLIPANASSASLTLQGIDNEVGEGSKRITLTLSGSLPTGWSFPTDASTHEIVLRDDDLAVGFTSSNTARVQEDVGDVTLSVVANQALTGAAEIAWSVTAGSDDLTSASTKSGTLSFQTGNDEDDPQTITLSVMDDSTAEDADEVTVTLTATTLPAGWSLGRDTHTVTIEPSDGVVRFAETSAITAREGETVSVGITSTADGPRGGYPLTISIPDGSNGSNDITFPSTVTLPEGQKTQNFSITIRRDDTPEREEFFTMSLGAGASAPADWSASGSRTIVIPLNEGRVSFASATGTAVEAGDPATTTITVAPAPTSQVTIPVTITATSGLGYALQSGDATVTNQITVGTSGTATLTLTPDRDTDTRGGTVTVRLGTPLPAGYDPGARSSWAVTVNDTNTRVEPDRIVGFADSSTTVLEGNSDTTTLIVNPPPSSPVTFTVTVKKENATEGSFALTAGSATVTESTTEVTVNDTGMTTFTLTANQDTDTGNEGGRVTVTLGGQLPELYSFGRKSWLGIVWDDEAEEIKFAQTALNYDNAVVNGEISAAVNFPTATLVTESSDGTLVEAGPQVPLPSGQKSVMFPIVPRGPIDSGSVTIKLTDPRGTLPFGWRIGSDDTITLTPMRTSTPANNTINLLPSAANGDATMVEEGSLLEMAVQAVSSGSIPPEGINLSLTVESVYVQPKQSGGEDRVPGSDKPAEVFGFGVPGFKAGAVLPDPHPDENSNSLGFTRKYEDKDTGEIKTEFVTYAEYRAEILQKVNKYTFKLTEENSVANIFAAIEDDGEIESPEEITFTLAPEGPLPSGWSLGTGTYKVTVSGEGRLGFASNLPTRTTEGSVACPTPRFALANERFIELPFEIVYPDTQRTYGEVSVTGRKSDGSTVSNIYQQVEASGQVAQSNRRFQIHGNGKMQTANVGIYVCADTIAEGPQILTVTVTLGPHSGATVGNLTHTITVLPSDNEIQFSTPVPFGTQEQRQAGVNLVAATYDPPTIFPELTQADKDEGFPLPSFLIVPATDNEADPDDYSLTVSGGELGFCPASGSTPNDTCPAVSGQPGVFPDPNDFLPTVNYPDGHTPRVVSESMKWIWTLPDGSPPTDMGLIVTPNTANIASTVNLKLDVTAINPVLGWDVPGGKHTITVPLNP